jgi:hypothetical protein
MQPGAKLPHLTLIHPWLYSDQQNCRGGGGVVSDQNALVQVTERIGFRIKVALIGIRTQVPCLYNTNSPSSKQRLLYQLG